MGAKLAGKMFHFKRRSRRSDRYSLGHESKFSPVEIDLRKLEVHVAVTYNFKGADSLKVKAFRTNELLQRDDMLRVFAGTVPEAFYVDRLGLDLTLVTVKRIEGDKHFRIRRFGEDGEP